ncbi:isopentenyl transferase family protein [Trinickia caryophylli]|uniref:Isopentenyl transferase n=1 Tax=Trinickia caryophylli TaxID=28094 RepID=A0A1X7D455_TRICW|nr:isopentenyl transferase family protein [Trinickia caryophylli]PMS12754.1 isopentenyl transferase [Trinickia caryophylli]TRX15162.1 isopentenyl transferase [Trinickia caryophylli]WQE15026.1 isopentenyl transferase family protein [Trinickia caryophylli]SMF08514.1 Isopentenyl transferase [Trinickia caryophylli]GLU31241.1 adenylate dimethylallyltransferase [Trinickia caryophylli]
MTIRLYMIWGPTTTGKTALSVALARMVGVPVLSLDRVQCCHEIAVGSGRPSPEELEGTAREYLCHRRVADGVVSAAEANRLLKAKVLDYSRHLPALILEGGSVSLFNEMTADDSWAHIAEWVLQRVPLPAQDVFMKRARGRARAMLDAPAGERSMLDELVDLWRDPRTHAVLEDIDGYRQLIGYARAAGIPVVELSNAAPEIFDDWVELIAREYWEHACWQEQRFASPPTCWRHVAHAW